MVSTRFRVLEQLADDHELVFKFFAVFSRFEYALKRSGFVRSDRNGAAEPHWNKFAESLAGRLSAAADTLVREARDRFLEAPPKTQVVVGGSDVGWAENPARASESPDEYLLRLVRTVRNNLFHGGKYPLPAGPVQDVARNRGLLQDSLVILNQCLALSPDLENRFAEAA